jgi:predicted DsbA family dithiol-disulfide isomerase
VPPHLVAKAAGQLGPAAFRAMHERLLHAYFAENRDITKGETLQAIWAEAGLPPEEFARVADESLLREVVAQHNEAIEIGVSGVPAVMMVGNDVPMMGAMSYDTYRKWVERRLEGEI